MQLSQWSYKANISCFLDLLVAEIQILSKYTKSLVSSAGGVGNICIFHNTNLKMVKWGTVLRIRVRNTRVRIVLRLVTTRVISCCRFSQFSQDCIVVWHMQSSAKRRISELTTSMISSISLRSNAKSINHLASNHASQ